MTPKKSKGNVRPIQRPAEELLEERGLPKNHDAERFVLSGILLNNEHFSVAARALDPDDFSLDRHRLIFRAMHVLAECEEHINSVSVGEELARRGELGSAGGMGYLTDDLERGMPQLTTGSFASFVRIVGEKSLLRRTIFAAQKVMSECAISTARPKEIIASHTATVREIEKLSARGRKHGVISIDEIQPLTAYGTGEVTWIHEPELIEGTVTAITGDSGCGKSTVALMHARAAIADGRHVLVLDRENPLSAALDHLKRLGIDPESPYLHYWGGWIGEEAPDPGSPEVMEWVQRITKETGQSPLVIVDSFSAFHGGDQNDAGQTRAFMEKLRRLADLGAGVELIHHDGKAESAKDYRGSSDFKASADQCFHVTNNNPEIENRLHTVTLRCYKSRHGFSGTVVYDYADGKFLRDNKPTAAVRTVTEQFTGLLRKNPGVTKTEFQNIAAKNGLKRNAVQGFLDIGVRAGDIRFVENQRCHGGRYYLASDASPDDQNRIEL